MIRPMQVSDAEGVAAIIRESLGYVCETPVVSERIGSLAADDHCITLVATGDDGHVLGFVHALRYDTLHRLGGWDVVSLAVAAAEQGAGVGTSLLSALESEATRRGGSYIRLNSRIEREAAHHFYESRGYTNDKLQKRFIKELPAAFISTD